MALIWAESLLSEAPFLVPAEASPLLVEVTPLVLAADFLSSPGLSPWPHLLPLSNILPVLLVELTAPLATFQSV